MSQILQNQTLEMTNVLSRRGKFTQVELQLEMQNIGMFFKENGIEKAGNIVTATYAVDTSSGIMDIEILVPMNKEILLPDGYLFKPIFKLVNAIKIRHEGNPAFLQKSADEMTEYIQENKLTPITVGYNVIVNEPKTPQDIDNMIVDIYVGVNPNIL